MESKHEKTEKSVFKCENVCKERERVSLLRGVQCNLLYARQEGSISGVSRHVRRPNAQVVIHDLSIPVGKKSNTPSGLHRVHCVVKMTFKKMTKN